MLHLDDTRSTTLMQLLADSDSNPAAAGDAISQGSGAPGGESLFSHSCVSNLAAAKQERGSLVCYSFTFLLLIRQTSYRDSVGPWPCGVGLHVYFLNYFVVIRLVRGQVVEESRRSSLTT